MNKNNTGNILKDTSGDRKSENLFKNPTAQFRGKPFWSWNGKLHKEELLRQIDVMDEMGMGGFFCHSRTGLITEYLGEEWFELINTCTEKGKELGLETWLYDEDRWPSGTAGGMVTENPEFRMRLLRLELINSRDFNPSAKYFAAFSVEREDDGFSYRNKKKIVGNGSVDGNTVLLFTIEEMEKESFYNGYTYVDTMNPDATAKYIELTHQKYKEKCGDHFGKDIKGIFTDEPHRGAVMCGFGFSNKNATFLTPFTDSLIPVIKENYGYDLTDFLPELFLWENGEKFHPVKWQYMETLQQLFLENFMAPIHKWCKENNILLTGHVLHEDNLTAQASLIGSVIRAYEHMDYPGVDVLTEGNDNYNIAKQIQSACRQLGKEWILSELYGCTGWQFDFESHKFVGDWQALFGVNVRCHHLSWYTMLGESKRDYPASILHQSAWYPQYKYVEDYFSRIGAFMTYGKPVCDLLVINPVESIWAMVYPGWSEVFSIHDPVIIKLEETYKAVFKHLNSEKLDFDFGDEDFIKRMGRVELIDGDVFIRVGESLYREVLLPGLVTIRKTTLDLLKEFADKGGKVIVAGNYPEYIDAKKSDEFTKLSVKLCGVDDIASNLNIEPFIKVTDEEGNNIPDIYAQAKRVEEDFKVMLLNINREVWYRGAKISISKKGFCEKWNPVNGDVTLIAKGDTISFEYDFAPGGELLLNVTEDNSGYEFEKSQKVVGEESIGTDFKYELTEPNVCVLDFVRYKIDDGAYSEKVEILQADRQIRRKSGVPLRGGQMLQPWFTGKLEHPFLCNLALEYDFNIEDHPGDIKLAIETPEIFGIKINGKIINEVTDDYWVDTCFKIIEIDKSLLYKGKNLITLECEFNESINLEAIYLLGNFGVELSGNKSNLVKLPAKLSFGDVTTQKLPFYGAGIKYKLDEIPKIEKGENLFIEADDFEAGCIRVSCGEKEKIIAFKPYETDISEFAGKGDTVCLEYILTRRNTFGPLHFRPGTSPGYGPDTFTIEGELHLHESYSLLPQGMTGQVKYKIMK